MDGTSTSLLEAMACGLPVVVTDIPSIMEWVEEGYNGYLVPRRDSVSLAAKIVQLLRDEKMQERMGRRNLRIAQVKADWDRNFEKLEEMYQLLVEGHRRK